MASFTTRMFRTLMEPMLKKHGIDLPPEQSPFQQTIQSKIAGLGSVLGVKAAQKYAVRKNQKGHEMGALLKFILINAASVIGAKLISEASERFSQKLFKEKTGAIADDPDHPDAPTLETRVCPKCGAFRIRGEQCVCGAK